MVVELIETKDLSGFSSRFSFFRSRYLVFCGLFDDTFKENKCILRIVCLWKNNHRTFSFPQSVGPWYFPANSPHTNTNNTRRILPRSNGSNKAPPHEISTLYHCHFSHFKATFPSAALWLSEKFGSNLTEQGTWYYFGCIDSIFGTNFVVSFAYIYTVLAQRARKKIKRERGTNLSFEFQVHSWSILPPGWLPEGGDWRWWCIYKAQRHEDPGMCVA